MEASGLSEKFKINPVKLEQEEHQEKKDDLVLKPKSVKKTISYKQAHDNAVTQMQKMAQRGQYTRQEAAYLMNATFIMRRFYIYKDAPSLDFMLKTYPLLFNSLEMKNELGRILHPGKWEIFLANIQTYAPLILNSLPTEDPLNNLIQNIIASCAPENKEYANIAGGILALPKILKEKRYFLHLKNEPLKNSKFPYIEAGNYEPKDILKKKARLEIKIEDYSLCETRSLPEALLCLISVYLALNYSYKNEHEEIKNGSKLPKIVEKYLNLWKTDTN